MVPAAREEVTVLLFMFFLGLKGPKVLHVPKCFSMHTSTSCVVAWIKWCCLMLISHLTHFQTCTVIFKIKKKKGRKSIQFQVAINRSRFPGMREGEQGSLIANTGTSSFHIIGDCSRPERIFKHLVWSQLSSCLSTTLNTTAMSVNWGLETSTNSI